MPLRWSHAKFGGLGGSSSATLLTRYFFVPAVKPLNVLGGGEDRSQDVFATGECLQSQVIFIHHAVRNWYGGGGKPEDKLGNTERWAF